MSTLFHPHVTCVWGDILIGLGTGVRAFKHSCEAFQTVGECPNHLHHVYHSGITTSTSWRFTSPISPVISRSSRPWSTCIIHCYQLLTIWSSVPLKSAVVTHIGWSRTFLWSGTRLGLGFRPAQFSKIFCKICNVLLDCIIIRRVMNIHPFIYSLESKGFSLSLIGQWQFICL